MKRKFSVVAAPVLSRAPQTREEKLQAAIAYLGDRWCLHPDFERARLQSGFLAAWRIQRYRT